MRILIVAAAPLLAAAALPMAWQLERHAHVTSGEKSCLLRSLGGHVAVVLAGDPTSGRPRASVRIGLRNQPGSTRYLRINEKFFQTAEDGFTGEDAQDIVARLRRPGVYVFEWARRPNAAKQGGLFGTGDFAARYDECLDWLGVRRT